MKRETVEEFFQELASKSPAPGGGSVSALSGSLGAGLVSMVSNLSLEEESCDFKELQQRMEREGQNFLQLMEDDTAAFNQVMEAFKLPKDDQKTRSQAIQKAFRQATEVPLQVMELSCQVLEAAERAVDGGNTNALSDSGVALLTATTALKGARYNVLINLPSIKDEALKDHLTQRMNQLYQRGKELSEELESRVEEALLGEL